MEPPPKFLKGYFGKPFKIKNRVRESIVRGEDVRHPTSPFKRSVTLSYLFKNKYDLNFNFILNYQEKLIYTNKNKNKTKKSIYTNKNKNKQKKIFFYIFGLDLGFDLGPTYP